jgi:hypothetical protein
MVLELAESVMDHLDEVGGEVRLYCHSTGREAKERGIERRFSTRLEAELQYLAEGLHVSGRVKRYEKVLTRIGRLRQRYSRVVRYYDIRLEQDAASGNAKTLVWTRITPTEDTLPGVYCLRTNQADWDERILWNTYTMLTDLEALIVIVRRLWLGKGNAWEKPRAGRNPLQFSHSLPSPAFFRRTAPHETAPCPFLGDHPPRRHERRAMGSPL